MPVAQSQPETGTHDQPLRWSPRIRLTGRCPDPIGIPRSTRMRCGRGGCPLYPQGRWCTYDRTRVSGRHLPHCDGNVPAPQVELPSSGAQLDEASSRVHCIHPSGLPLACVPRMERAPLGFSPELRTLPLPATHVRVGTGIEHLPGPTQSTSSVDPPSHESTRIVRPRVAPRDSYLPMNGT